MSISNNATGLRPGVCTSTSRPTTPYTGQIIYETDTNNILSWNGSAWRQPWNTPWGTIDLQASYATTAFSAATALTVLSSTFTAVAGRRYLVTGRIGVQVTGTAATSNALWITQTTLGVRTLAYETIAITQFHCKLFSGSVTFAASDLGVSSGSSSRTIDMRWRCGASGALNTDPDAIVGTNSVPHQLIIQDIGPS